MMRVLLAALLFLAALAISGAAQPTPRFGVEIGVDMANTTGNGWDTWHDLTGLDLNNKHRTGVVAGGVARMTLGATGLTVQPELLYVEKGAKVRYTGRVIDPLSTEPSSFVANYKFTYLELPVTLRYSVPTRGPVSPALFAGPFLAVNLSASASYEDVPQDLGGSSRINFGDTDVGNAAAMDFGFTVGAGVDVSVSSAGTLSLNIRYTFGLSEMTDDIQSSEDIARGEVALINYDTNEGLNLKNSDFRLTVGYLF